ncbi:MAG: PIG-L family deacetylase [Oscillospiraceae bacterium]
MILLHKKEKLPENQKDTPAKKSRIRTRLFKIICLTVAFVVLVGACYTGKSIYVRNKYVTTDFATLDLTGIDNLMIVAHPDDDIIWGGAHLMEGSYLVVCVTGGTSEVRAKEFLKAMDRTGDKAVMLGFPDKVLGKRSNWKNCSDDIEKDLTEIMALKHWNMIVTHNPDGEYGHNQHILTDQLVTKAYNQVCADEDNLWYFGKYYSPAAEKDYAATNPPRITDAELVEKTDIIEDIYTSQGFVMDKFGQMLPFENWTKYTA